MRISVATATDAPEAAKLLAVTVDAPWSESMIASALDSAQAAFFRAEDGGVTVGYALAETVLDEAEIEFVAVDGTHRRKGIGTLLMSACLDAAKGNGAKSCYLEVNATNTAAIGLYEKFGFERSYVRKKYYGQNDAIVMKKLL